MKDILELIEQKKTVFSALPLFKYMQDKSIPARQRLAWCPCLTPMAMDFGDVWKYTLRREPTNDPIQLLINQHTREDENHWKWFPDDVARLGFMDSSDFSDSIRFLWSQETQKTRKVCKEIALLTHNAEPVEVLIAIEAIEATANVVFTLTSQVVQELDDGNMYRYFGSVHLVEDSSHSVFEGEKSFVDNIVLDDAQKQRAIEMVEQIFEIFTEACDEMMAYAQKTTSKSKVLVAA